MSRSNRVDFGVGGPAKKPSKRPRSGVPTMAWPVGPTLIRRRDKPMKRFFYIMVTALLLLPALAGAQKPAAAHPDLSGLWLFSIDLPPTALKKEVNGNVEIKKIDASGRRPAKSDVAGALPSTPAPSYKPEFQAKVKQLSDNESKLDPVFYCGKPGTPRIGPPRRIIQQSNQLNFLYSDI